MTKLVFGVGVSNAGKHRRTILINGKKTSTREYSLWTNMLQRCYNLKFQQKWPSYIGCTVSENFKDFQFFAEWCNNQIGFNCDKPHIEKDILFKGNKLYSEDTCVFVPAKLNTLILKSNASRGEFPIGVSWHKQHLKYKASCRSSENKLVHLGYFENQTDAFIAYKLYKESLVKHLAEKYKYDIENRVYNALINYEVLIDD